MENRKTTYVLVHGAWHGSWCWKSVRAALQSAVHNVFTPTLTGLGERSHLNSAAINLSLHIADIVNLIQWEELSALFSVATLTLVVLLPASPIKFLIELERWFFWMPLCSRTESL